MKASVKVMRSFDYCHFEINLGSDDDSMTLEQVDALRKDAARLADKAVEQYKIAKLNAQRCLEHQLDRANLVRRMGEIRLIPEQERTVRQQAELKAFDDAAYQAYRNYDYEDDWSEE